MPKWRTASLILLVLAWTAVASAAEELIGRVVGITDGDTLTLLVAEGSGFKPVKIRLAEIDAPERRQPYGTQAKQVLSDLAYNQSARVVVQDTDRYGRTVGRVYVGSTDVSAEMIRQGAAWVYRKYSRDPALLDRETQAKAAKRGLWALPEAQRVEPCEWRHFRSVVNVKPVHF